MNNNQLLSARTKAFIDEQVEAGYGTGSISASLLHHSLILALEAADYNKELVQHIYTLDIPQIITGLVEMKINRIAH